MCACFPSYRDLISIMSSQEFWTNTSSPTNSLCFLSCWSHRLLICTDRELISAYWTVTRRSSKDLCARVPPEEKVMGRNGLPDIQPEPVCLYVFSSSAELWMLVLKIVRAHSLCDLIVFRVWNKWKRRGQRGTICWKLPQDKDARLLLRRVQYVEGQMIWLLKSRQVLKMFFSCGPLKETSGFYNIDPTFPCSFVKMETKCFEIQYFPP